MAYHAALINSASSRFTFTRSLFNSPLIVYSLLLFLIGVGDAIMSYLSPVYIEQQVANPLLMGLVISSSAFVGLICDLLFAKWFPNKKYIFFYFWSLIAAILFPLILLFLPPLIPFLILSMTIWGIYYELSKFSNATFVNQNVPQANFPHAWGTLNAFKAAAYLIGPLLAGLLLNFNWDIAFLTPIIFYIAVFSGMLVFRQFPKPELPSLTQNKHRSLGQQIQIWKILLKNIWPIYLFLFLISVTDATFWTIGTLISEQLRLTHPLGVLFLPAYSLPSLALGYWLNRHSPSSGKKRLAFISAGISGILLLFVGTISHPLWLILLVLLSSVFSAIAYPHIFAVFEDYIHRLGNLGSDMIGLQSSAVSASYILGPIIAGGLAALVGNRQAFTVLGGFIAIYSLVALIYLPRKIRLPQSDLAKIIS